MNSFIGKLSNARFNGFLLIVLLISSVIILFLPSNPVSAELWNSSSQGNYLHPKWVGYVAGGGEAIVTADVLANVPGEEVFHAGGPAQPSETAGRVTCLNGRTGDEIWRTTIPCIGDTATLQMADIDGDGKLEIVVALQAPAGLYILNAEDGSLLWCAPGTYTYNGTTISGFITPIGGRIDGSGVIGDIDGNGYPNLFIGVMAYEEQPDTGKLLAYEWDPIQQTMVEQARTQVWHPCAGGLSLGDTDNDGTYELYMNERDVYYGDGSWGRGLTSFWADNLTLRWRVYDWGASSDIPMLVDVNKDGITDVVSTNLGTGICVLNSTDGRPLTNAAGTVLCDPQLGLPVHYQSSIYDIDQDGNLELLCADGTHSATSMGLISNLTMIWDLYDWHLDGVIDPGLCFRGPSVGEVTGDGLMDIIVATYNEEGNNSDTVKIYNQNYQLVDQYVGLRRPAIGTVVQDIDRDDNGLNELLVLTQGGIIYCFDTPGLSQEKLGLPRARSEIHFYSESRLGASEYVPFNRPYPDVSAPNIMAGAVNVSTSVNQLSFTLSHPLGQTMNYTVTTTPNIGTSNGINVGNGVQTFSVSGLAASTLYRWQINVTDEAGYKTSRNYWFNTAPYITNTAPTQGTPTLSLTGDSEDLTCSNQSTTDVNHNSVTNVYNWLKNGVSIANLNLPFDSKPDATAVYSGYAVTRDYSGIGNDGTVFGATWAPGVVGGGFSFDGNDFIRIEEQGNSLGGDGSWQEISVECWIKATQTMNSKPVIWKTDRYDTAEVGYQLDCSADLTNQQLTYTWYIYTQTSVYTVAYTLTSGVADWHHVVCTYKSGVGLTIYVDGTQKANSYASGNINATDGPLEIAFNSAIDYSQIVDLPSYMAALSDFVGVLDEVKVYPTAVSAAYTNQRYLDTKDGLSSESTIPHSSLTVNDRWTCQVTPNDGLTDGSTKTSTIRISPPTIFADGFESGNFNVWTSSTNTTGGTASVVSSLSHSGVYSAQFNINAGNGTRRAYTYKNLDGLSELYASAYVYIADGLPLADGQSLWFIQLTNSSGATIGSFGVRADTSGSCWAIQYSNWPYTLATSGPSEGNWYHIEVYYADAASGKTLTIFVDDVEVASLNQDTTSSSAVTSARFGIGYYTGTTSASVYIDDASISMGEAQLETPSYLVVRGGDNEIFYRQYNPAADSWNNWNKLPNGATATSPAATLCMGKMYFAVLGSDGSSLWLSSVDVANGDFSGWSMIDGATNASPALTSDGTNLFLAVKGLDDTVFYRTYNCLLNTWGNWNALPGTTCDRIAIAIQNNRLNLVVRSSIETQVLWSGSVNLADDSFSGWTNIPGLTDSAPTLTSSATQFYLLVRGLDDRIYINTLSSGVWQGWIVLNGLTCDSVAATVVGGNLEIVVRSVDGDALWHCSLDLNTNVQSVWELLNGNTPSSPIFG